PREVRAVVGLEDGGGRDEQVERVALEGSLEPQAEVRLVEIARGDVLATPADCLRVAAVPRPRLEVAELVLARRRGPLRHTGLQLLEARMRRIIVFAQRFEPPPAVRLEPQDVVVEREVERRQRMRPRRRRRQSLDARSERVAEIAEPAAADGA